MRQNNRYPETGSASSVLNQDQLEQIVSRNQSFIRDFLLVICSVIVFMVILLFIVLINNINKSVELANYIKIDRQRAYLANLDLRARTPTKMIDLNRPAAATIDVAAKPA
ncbi:ORF-65 [Agrotis segetum nucleopolyhedrovirus A]|uniref:ORF-65 n=1 Tax=Agrotis segetum nuclear polyhedrosis virus TaxID=1962501 RepID=Q287K7_NPVAS|nr:ORF-65 [Agrotis segetum nucleopolyhedrovirus A]AAZ38231.1 ORF-65 [Agrotis segetum nucleopolyhedrovirus A]